MALTAAAGVWNVDQESHRHETRDQVASPRRHGHYFLNKRAGRLAYNAVVQGKWRVFRTDYKPLTDVTDWRDESRWVIQGLVREKVLPPALFSRVVNTLMKSLPIGAIKPYVAFDSDEAEYSMTWIVNSVRVEISIPATGPIYVNCDRIGTLGPLEGFYREVPHAALRERIAALTQVVRESGSRRIS